MNNTKINTLPKFKWVIQINQYHAMRLGFKNASHVVIFELLASASTWASPIVIEGEVYYWVARQATCDQLPLWDFKPNTVYKYYRELADLGVIEHVKHGKKDCIRITEKGKTYFHEIADFPMSENNPSSGENSENNPSNTPNNSENNPTYKKHKQPYKEHNINIGGDATLSIEIEDHELGAMSREQLEKYCSYRKGLKKKLPMSHRALITIVNELNKLPPHITIDEAIEHCEEKRWKGFKAQWVARDLSTDNPDYLPEYKQAAFSVGMDDAEATQLFAKMVSHYRSRGIQIVNWADQWVTWVNNECIKDVQNRNNVYTQSSGGQMTSEEMGMEIDEYVEHRARKMGIEGISF